jgi:peptidoglycan/LPS O-acetylase OafA/YrhL
LGEGAELQQRGTRHAPVHTGQTSAFAYQPALDGVRALAVALVILFHLELGWMPGGYLGVSVFFTLSGFLITSLLLSERARRNRISVKAFYARRVRRLAPASLVCLSGITLLAGADILVGSHTTRTDIVGALLQVTNWQQLLSNQSYADLFASPSPVAHFWSLAIEEQFYWVWPLAMAGVTALVARRRRTTVARVLASAYVVFAIGAVLTARLLGSDAAYLTSWSRFAEILAGAALAAVVMRRPIPARGSILAPICLTAIVVLAVVTPSGHGWAYEGGLPLFALLTVGLIVGLQPAGAVRGALSQRPVVWVGRISYELYLFHWPIFLLVTEERTGLHGGALALTRVGLTVAVSALVFHAIEQPVRTRRVLARTRPMFATAFTGGLTVLLVAAVLVPASTPHRGPRPAVLGATQLAPVATARSVDVAPDSSAPTPPRATSVAIFGDSVPDWLLRDAAPSYVRTDITVVNGAHEACDGAVALPIGRDRRGKMLAPPPECQEWPVSYPQVVENPAQPIDIAVLMIGQAPYVDRLINDQWTGPCDSIDWYTTDVAARVTYLRKHVGKVVLALPSWSGDHVRFMLPDDHRARMTCIRTALLALATTDHMPMVDLAALLCPEGPDGKCDAYTGDDGAHVNPSEAGSVLNWLLDSLPITRRVGRSAQ